MYTYMIPKTTACSKDVISMTYMIPKTTACSKDVISMTYMIPKTTACSKDVISMTEFSSDLSSNLIFSSTVSSSRFKF